jgi:hypothetical protein
MGLGGALGSRTERTLRTYVRTYLCFAWWRKTPRGAHCLALASCLARYRFFYLFTLINLWPGRAFTFLPSSRPFLRRCGASFGLPIACRPTKYRAASDTFEPQRDCVRSVGCALLRQQLPPPKLRSCSTFCSTSEYIDSDGVVYYPAVAL